MIKFNNGNLIHTLKRLLKHSLFWLLFIFLNWFMTRTEYGFLEFIDYHFLNLSFSILLFYTHYKLLTYYRVLWNIHFVYTFLITILEIIAFSIVLELIIYLELDHELEDYEFTQRQFALNIFFTSIMVIGASLYYFIKDHLIKSRKLMILEIEFLKKQINPHFFNNELNNIQALLDKDDVIGTKDYLKDLSEYLVYSLKNDMNDHVLLRDELNSIFGYLDNLERRNEGVLDIDYSLEGQTNNLQIRPLILMTFVENSIKHSQIEFDSTGFIRIHVKVDKNRLEFIVINNIANHKYIETETTYIGLQNVKKRLNLQYQQRYELVCENRGGQYYVKLILELDDQK